MSAHMKYQGLRKVMWCGSPKHRQHANGKMYGTWACSAVVTIFVINLYDATLRHYLVWSWATSGVRKDDILQYIALVNMWLALNLITGLHFSVAEV